MEKFLVEVVAYKDTEKAVAQKYEWKPLEYEVIQNYIEASGIYEAVTKFLLVKGYKAEAVCVTLQEEGKDVS